MSTAESTLPPLEQVTRPTLTTAEYSYYRNIPPQTARIHACKGTGGITPRRIGGRLHWPTAEVKRLMGVL